MGIAIVTGAFGLVGSAVSEALLGRGYEVIGIDNDQRKSFFGESGSTRGSGSQPWTASRSYQHLELDIRDKPSIESLIAEHSKNLSLLVHTAAQPSHDWSGKNPLVDFEINCVGTLNLLEALRGYCPEARFIFISTNKVYGDSPNRVDLITENKRLTPAEGSEWANGFTERLPLDQSTHSPFGVSKAAADLYTQEYGRYYGLRTAILRPGCLTGSNHSGVKLHGFLSYLTKAIISEGKYEVIGHGGLQVRDNLDATDLAEAIIQLSEAETYGDVFNIGGGYTNSVSVLEAVAIVEQISGIKAELTLTDRERIGDHRWYVTDNSKFKSFFPHWEVTVGLEEVIRQIVSKHHTVK